MKLIIAVILLLAFANAELVGYHQVNGEWQCYMDANIGVGELQRLTEKYPLHPESELQAKAECTEKLLKEKIRLVEEEELKIIDQNRGLVFTAGKTDFPIFDIIKVKVTPAPVVNQDVNIMLDMKGEQNDVAGFLDGLISAVLNWWNSLL